MKGLLPAHAKLIQTRQSGMGYALGELMVMSGSSSEKPPTSHCYLDRSIITNLHPFTILQVATCSKDSQCVKIQFNSLYFSTALSTSVTPRFLT